MAHHFLILIVTDIFDYRAAVERLAEKRAKKRQKQQKRDAEKAEKLKVKQKTAKEAETAAKLKETQKWISSWQKPAKASKSEATPLPIDLWTRVLDRLCDDLETEGVRGFSAIARDICNVGLTCKELHSCTENAFRRLSQDCAPVQLENEWITFLKDPSHAKVDEMKALARSLDNRVIMSQPKPLLMRDLLAYFKLQTPSQVPVRLISGVQRGESERWGHGRWNTLYRLMLRIPDLREFSRDATVFELRKYCTDRGYTHLSMLETAAGRSAGEVGYWSDDSDDHSIANW